MALLEIEGEALDEIVRQELQRVYVELKNDIEGQTFGDRDVEWMTDTYEATKVMLKYYMSSSDFDEFMEEVHGNH